MFKNKIAKRLIIYLLIFSSVITLVLTSIQLYLDYKQDILIINQRISLIEISNHKSLEDSVWKINHNSLILQLEGIFHLPDIAYLEVKNEKGAILASVGSYPRKGFIKKDIPLDYVYRGKKLLIGRFQVVASLNGVYQRLIDTCLVILISQAIKTFLVSFFVFFVFQILVTRHLVKLADYAKGLSSDHLSEPFSFERKHGKMTQGDEVEQLADAINSMRNNLATSYSRLRTTLESLARAQQVAHIGNWEWDLGSNVTTWSDELCQIVGLDRQEYDGTYETYLDRIHPQDKERFKALTKRIMVEKKPYHAEYRIVRKNDGVVRHVREDAVVSVNEDGNPLNVLGTVQDITERKLSEQELGNSKALLLSLIDSIPDLIFYKDRQSVYLGANRAFAEFINQNEDNIVGKTDIDFFHPELAEFFREKDRQMLAQNAPRRNDEWVTYPDGRDVLLDTLKTPYYAPDGTVLGIIGVSRDITEQKAVSEEREDLNRQLQQSQKMESIGTLAGGIAHDFNNILMAILGYTELAKKSLPPESKPYNDLNKVVIAGKRAIELVKQILTFSRINDEERHPLKIHLIIKEVLKLLRASIPATVEIKQKVPENLGTVLADPTQIHQVIMNLCTNAYHAMTDTGGTLEVSLTAVELVDDATVNHTLAPGKYLRIDVSDNGCGMRIETLDKIFEPYFTTKEKDKGTGLGLSVVHGIVKSHGGDITVNSEYGAGTTFHIYLPKIETEIDTGIEEITEGAEEFPGGNERILVVDDEPPIVHLTHQMLEDLGYRVTPFVSSTEALQELLQNFGEFDLVITDMTMPKLTGVQLAQKILEIEPQMPIIICTGFSEKIDIDRAEILGIREYLAKPISKNDLAKCVRRVLDKCKTNDI